MIKLPGKMPGKTPLSNTGPKSPPPGFSALRLKTRGPYGFPLPGPKPHSPQSSRNLLFGLPRAKQGRPIREGEGPGFPRLGREPIGGAAPFAHVFPSDEAFGRRFPQVPARRPTCFAHGRAGPWPRSGPFLVGLGRNLRMLSVLLPEMPPSPHKEIVWLARSIHHGSIAPRPRDDLLRPLGQPGGRPILRNWEPIPPIVASF